MTDQRLPAASSGDEEQPRHSPSTQEHREAAPSQVACAVLTVSDTRTEATDASGAIIRESLLKAGHTVAAYRIVPDEPDQIRSIIGGWLVDASIAAVLTNGGTGIASRDTTYDAVSGLIEKRLDGFGELFRMLSFEEIGAAAMLSRAVAGVAHGTLIISMPGSRNAVSLAMDRLIAPELGHLVYEVTK